MVQPSGGVVTKVLDESSMVGVSASRCLTRWCGRTVALMLLLCELRTHGEDMYESVLWQRVFECREMCTCNGIPLENTTDTTPNILDFNERTANGKQLLYTAMENPEVFASHLFVRFPASRTPRRIFPLVACAFRFFKRFFLDETC